MQSFVLKSVRLPRIPLWERADNQRKLFSFELEITARCNNNCRHCYINLPAEDKEAKSKELSFGQIKQLANQAADLGALWCCITGGEPLLREDFFDIYLYLKNKGILTSVFTNATLITKKHVNFFRKYPPRDIEITVYGVSKETYERVSRTAGSFDSFVRGLELLKKNGIKVRLKAMALRSNAHELPEIAGFCRGRTKDYFRFDPFLHLRLDGNIQRNKYIKSERLSAQEIRDIEQQDPERFQALEKSCDKLIMPEATHAGCNRLFHCGAGKHSFSVSYDGYFRLCPSLCHPGCIYDLKKGTLKFAWEGFASKIRDMRSDNKEFLEKCRKCQIINLCLWCPAHSYLENKELDRPVEYFCAVANARAASLAH